MPIAGLAVSSFGTASITDYLSSKESLLRREYRSLAVLFCDIRSFDGKFSFPSSDMIVQYLDGHFRLMADIIYAKEGIIDKFIGDAIMAYFGYPASSEKTALQAVLAAMEMVEAANRNSGQYPKTNLLKCRLGISISFGEVTMGNVGHPEKKLSFTIFGDMVNLCSRIQGMTKTYGLDILISESVQIRIKDVLPCRLVDTIEVRGKGSE